ncbi:YhcH/YjgK/YiaL family protein [Natranaerovirga hydrolytica]|uniref:YhcH/YjgK/YiaL family protein n=1 Tax=Natranaerovirga hydrolytica TaxID=680378 RepID=A0A4R1MIZ9_9FIRM|nr:YhcH/YjgK/YiaL family protein [Natranaerovirga hydrolytica]TCK92718.1 YhcH/YjgK/YiaL family protein [Natranaerovirga hydrolytica]
MLTSKLTLAEKYDYLSDDFIEAFEFLKNEDLSQLKEGTYPIKEDKIIVNVEEYLTIEASQVSFETHNKYFDIHYVVEGEEKFGYVNRSERDIKNEYNEIEDITFYKEPQKSGYVVLNKGDFVIVSPEDAHKPRCTVDKPCKVKKIVIKILAYPL